MQPGQLQVDVPQLEATAGEWSQRSAALAALTPPSLGQPFQPTTAAVSTAHAAVDLAAAALTTRAQETTVAVETGATRYATNEAISATEMTVAS
ncbi:hypothetical protein [Mycobacterium sp.]|uniref:hypothetical protein n=1 Tax=Mycobacterium sp. TaxID=1785 RepID=UPI003BAA44E9